MVSMFAGLMVSSVVAVVASAVWSSSRNASKPSLVAPIPADRAAWDPVVDDLRQQLTPTTGWDRVQEVVGSELLAVRRLAHVRQLARWYEDLDADDHERLVGQLASASDGGLAATFGAAVCLARAGALQRGAARREADLDGTSDLIRQAATLLDEAVALDADDALAWTLRIRLATLDEASLQDARRCLDRVARRAPDLVHAHLFMLEHASPRRQGSRADMWAVVEAATRDLPPGNLCWSLVAVAHFEQWTIARSGRGGPAQAAATLYRPDVRAEIAVSWDSGLAASGFHDGPEAVLFLNLYAWLFTIVGDAARASAAFAAIGARHTRWPWSLIDPEAPEAVFAEARDAVGTT